MGSKRGGRSVAKAPVANSDSADAIQRLAGLDSKLTDLLQPIVDELQQLLAGLEGMSFGFDTNKAIVEAVQVQLQRLGMRVNCPRCGAAAIPRCRATKTAKDGSFQFEHYQEGRQTNHGGSTTFPALKLVPAPPDQRRTRKKRQK